MLVPRLQLHWIDCAKEAWSGTSLRVLLGIFEILFKSMETFEQRDNSTSNFHCGP